MNIMRNMEGFRFIKNNFFHVFHLILWEVIFILRFGKGYLLLLVLMFLLMGSVCAVNETYISDNVDSSLDANVLGVSEDDEVLGDEVDFSGTTFSELQTEIYNARAGDAINLHNDVRNTPNIHVPIKIDKEITIDGNGYTLNANKQSSIFRITGNNVVLKNIIFKNGKRNNAFGGAIEWNGVNGTVINCSFINNTVNGGTSTNSIVAYGGAIFFQRDGTIINCSFVNNKATTYNTKASGGAVAFFRYEEGSTINPSLINCSFVNNTATANPTTGGGFGGAVYVYGTLYGSFNVTVVNCSFGNNTALTSGGAVYIDGENYKNINKLYTIVANCSFVANKATGTSSSNGGAVYINKATATIADSRFADNAADSYGGAVYFDKTSGTVVNSSFANNVAKTFSGGAVYVGRYSNGVAVNCSFANNTANAGGAFDADYTSGTVINCTFVNNKAMGFSGGAVNFEHGAAGVVFKSSFVNNKAPTVGIGTGGAISGSKTVTNCSFENNFAGLGGAVYGYGSVKDCIFVNNTATSSNGAYGGAIYLSDANSIVNNCSFVNNSRSVVYTSKNNCRVIDCSFVNNMFCALRYDGNNGYVINCSFVNTTSTGSLGGAIQWKGARATLNKCSFVNNTASYGGAIYFYGEIKGSGSSRYGGAINSRVVDCSFANNMASTFGGAIYIKANDCTVADSSFINNSVTQYGGGAIYLEEIKDYGLVCTVVNSSFTNNRAKQSSGGAICFIGVRDTLVNCNFVNNTAKSGGAVSLFAIGGISSSSANVINCSFANNTATEFGGAIIFNSYKNVINGYVLDSRFVNNAAESGGAALFLSSSGTFTTKEITAKVTNCSFVNNAATESGGAIRFFGARYAMNGFVEDSIFVNNTAESGGAINFYTNKGNGFSWRYTSGTVTNSSFVNNTAKTNGGALHFYTATGAVSNSSFVDNKANNDAGAIYFEVIPNIRASGNSNEILGAADSNDGLSAADLGTAQTAVEGSSFVNNLANNNGGAVYFTANNGVVVDSSFVNNTVKNYGGAIYSICLVNVSGSNFTGNRAFSGSAWYANNDGNIEDSILLDNKANSSSLIVGVVVNDRDVLINSTLYACDNLLNAIYNNGNTFHLKNVTYLGFEGIMNTGSDSVFPVGSADLSDDGVLTYQDEREARQDIILEIYDSNNNLIYSFIDVSDIYGTVYSNLRLAFGEYSVRSYFYENNYYTEIANGTKFKISPPIADLVVNKVSNVSTAEIGNLVEWIITVVNNGPGIAFDVNLTEFLPDGLGFVSANPSKGDYRGNVWTIGDMNNCEIQTLKIVTKVLKLGQIFNTVGVVTSSNDTNLTNNATCEITVVDSKNETQPDNNKSQNSNETQFDNNESQKMNETESDSELIIDSNPVGVKYTTGNPIFTLLLVLFALVGFRKRIF